MRYVKVTAAASESVMNLEFYEDDVLHDKIKVPTGDPKDYFQYNPEIARLCFHWTVGGLQPSRKEDMLWHKE